MNIRIIWTLALSLMAVDASAEPLQLTTADYDRAARFLARNQEASVLNAEVSIHWLPGEDRFWYRRSVGVDRTEFVVVDASAGGRRMPAFDHAAVAAALSKALERPVEADRLPFQTFRYGASGAVEAIIDNKLWSCSGATMVCSGAAAPEPSMTEVASPDGKWFAYVENDNLWVRPASGGESFALSAGGAPNYSFATHPGSAMVETQARIEGRASLPDVVWSPDSKHILTQRLDDRQAGEMGLMQSAAPDGSVRPKLHRWAASVPNDPVPSVVEPWVFDVATRRGRKIDVPQVAYSYFTPVAAKENWWSRDGRTIGLVARDRYRKTLTLYAIDPETGGARTVLSETSKTFIEANLMLRRPMVALLESGDVLWFSERDGQGRLYLYGLNGKIKRILTPGAGQVTNVVRIDEAAGFIWARINGREPGADPYQSNLYRISLRTGTMLRLTPEKAEHGAGANDDAALEYDGDPLVGAETTTSISPSGRFFVDTYSTVNTLPVSVVRRANGQLVSILEKADLTPLKESGGVTLPEPFTVKAADGTTTLYGVLLRPSNFDPAKRYAIIDQYYPGPQNRRTPGTFTGAMFDYSFAQAMAELGFVVVLVDGRGTPGRSKTFLDFSYGKMADVGTLEDHVAAIRELAKARPWMDVDRVGIYGISGGGNATARAMFLYPDFYKVGVAHAGNHDLRGYLIDWAETYNGPIVGNNYAATSNAAIAKNLKGKLLLMHGDMDANVPPALTMQVVDALIKANKDFDMLLVPNLSHAWNDYTTRVTWDYMVRNLMGAVPPKEYQMSKVEP
ncbi:prolyl oligopeptidase family serine peptidase [Sphingopyxis sp. JAI128]|uniref:S9 family peptidase n=1 Tax=Sphingopyxis sp. JAI128 TaxID=2723066 RepID=UPI00160DBFD7|nr:prolyl oligopeptidase family serine peptidase [Sphingopyxis sp. JAI128]MBB6428162.1 dienelactone hydrolase [Sphingopyxis sp. JAI128]